MTDSDGGLLSRLVQGHEAGALLLGQFIRYAIVGLISNGILYSLYLIVTAWGLAPKSAMTILYAIGVLQTFLFNKGWTFHDGGRHGAALIRYCIAYASGYAINYVILVIFVDRLRMPHQIVQGVVILSLAVYLFLLQRFWVFRRTRSAPAIS